MKVIALTSAAMVAFAGNSLLCRMALGGGLIDAGAFSVVRVTSGAAVLSLFLLFRRREGGLRGWRGQGLSALWLSIYLVGFSLAYLSLSVGTGALILFGAVQIAMFIAGLRAGESFRPLGWLGFLLAAGGMVALVLPGVSAPSPFGAALMALAGVAWGLYSLRGRGAADPVSGTALNFLLALPIVAALGLPLSLSEPRLTGLGVGLAAASGGLASGLGYVLWYAALRGLEATTAAAVQLVVPALAALGGVLLLSEALTARLLGSSAVVLGGIALLLWSRRGEAPGR